MHSLVLAAQERGCTIGDLVLEQQAAQLELPQQALLDRMDHCLEVMEQASLHGRREDLRSASGLSGGSAFQVLQRARQGVSLCGPVFSEVICHAIAVSEYNACMGRIVASPTAGSCGILPAVLLTAMEQGLGTRQECLNAMFTASAVGMVIAENACLAGAQGGCQAECGSASAMAAAALTQLCGGTAQMVETAVAIAIGNILGLVCDPVAGLVEVPCVMRNASGAVNAFTAAEIALAGVSSVIPADETIAAMKAVGDQMPSCLKETAQGGLAATPTGKRLFQEIFGTSAT